MVRKLLFLILFNIVLLNSSFALDQTPLQEIKCTIDKNLFDKEYCFNKNCTINISRYDNQNERFNDKRKLNFNQYHYTIEETRITTQYSYGIEGTGFDFFPDDYFLEIIDQLCIEDITILNDFSKEIKNHTGFSVDILSSDVKVNGFNWYEFWFSYGVKIIILFTVILLIIGILLILKKVANK